MLHTKYKAYTLKAPHRVVYDIYDTSSKHNFKNLALKNTYINSIKVYRFDKKLRLVFYTDSHTKHAEYRHEGDHLHELAIVFNTSSAAELQAHRDSGKINQAPLLRDIKVLIDPGHGGDDPGAVGIAGVREKDITLRVAIQLERLLKKEQGITPILTRHIDKFLHIRKRLKYARKKQADIFISIHADGFEDSRIRGASVYTLSKKV